VSYCRHIISTTELNKACKYCCFAHLSSPRFCHSQYRQLHMPREYLKVFNYFIFQKESSFVSESSPSMTLSQPIRDAFHSVNCSLSPNSNPSRNPRAFHSVNSCSQSNNEPTNPRAFHSVNSCSQSNHEPEIRVLSLGELLSLNRTTNYGEWLRSYCKDYQ
jgi:hypothetical protein